MVRNDLLIKVPTFFKCPISLDVMKSPVSLCTGVTYDRSSIQKWLDKGNNTCPATMQVLQSKEIIPNHTLQRLIKIWSDSANNQPDSDHSTAGPALLSSEQVRVILEDVKNRAARGEGFSDLLSKLGRFARESEKNRELLVNASCVPVLAGVIGETREIGTLEDAVKILGLVLITADANSTKLLMNPNVLDSFLLILQKGDLDSRIDCARLIEIIAFDAQSKHSIAEKEGFLDGLLKLASLETNTKAIDAGLSCLIALSIIRRIRLHIIRFRAVPVLGKLLFRSDSGTVEKVLKLLEMISALADGRTAICEDPVCIPAIVQRMKVSSSVTEHAVVILWSVCHLFRNQKAQEALVSSNGLTKILLLMQSNCSPAVRQMSSDLLKIYRVSSKNCLSCYDTKTTHIMPF